MMLFGGKVTLGSSGSFVLAPEISGLAKGRL